MKKEMMKVFFAVAVVFIGVSVAHADVLDVLRISKAQGVTLLADDSLSVTGENVAYSGAFVIDNQVHAVQYKAEGTTVALKLELEQGMELPAIPGAASTSWVIPEGQDEIDASLSDANMHIAPCAPTAAQYARLKVTGLGGNGANTKLTTIKVGRKK
jgi:hypothetical protein